jgi:hypothetical protein
MLGHCALASGPTEAAPRCHGTTPAGAGRTLRDQPTITHATDIQIAFTLNNHAETCDGSGSPVLLVAEGAKDGVILVAGDVEVMKALPA